MKTFSVTLLAIAALAQAAPAEELSPRESLGRAIFFDPSLSANGDMSCATCHEPAQGFSGPLDPSLAVGGVVQGSVPGRFGNRNPPSAAYGSLAPVFHHVIEDGEVLFVGGNFLDGRATGGVTGNAAADQAMMPFLNPLEMALPGGACVVQRVCASLQGDMTAVWGAEICQIDFPADLEAHCADPEAEIAIADEDLAARIDAAYMLIGQSLASFEASGEVEQFNSQFDQWRTGKAGLSELEMTGMDLFMNKGECAACHVMTPGPNGEPPVFTDFTYDNLGVPRNPANPWYGQPGNDLGAGWSDPGLGGVLEKDPIYVSLSTEALGKQKVPSLRNVAKQAGPESPRHYMHNGYFQTLEGVVHFYNTRDVLPACAIDLTTEAQALAQNCWPAAEVPATVNRDELGNLKLTAAEEAAIVAFLKTLSDQ